MRNKKESLLHFFSTLLLLGIGWFFYSISPFFTQLFSSSYFVFFLPTPFLLKDAFLVLTLIFICLLLPYYLFFPNLHSSSTFSLIQDISHKKFSNCFRFLRTFLLKFYFIPVCLSFFLENFCSLLNHFHNLFASLQGGTFLLFLTTSFSYFALNFILAIDTGIFVFGYTTESPLLKNTIKSVDPSWLGWLVCFLCYPPFNGFFTSLVGWYAATGVSVPNHPTWNIFVNIVMLLCMGIYALATVNLGAKASNLTSRGLVSYGLYKYIRHPAYASKNFVFWVSTVAIIFDFCMSGQWLLAATVVVSTSCWTLIYHLRAITEERHLQKTDGAYQIYMTKVKYRYIPFVI